MTPATFRSTLIKFYGDDFIALASKELDVNATTIYRQIADGGDVPGPVIAWAREKKKLIAAKAVIAQLREQMNGNGSAA